MVWDFVAPLLACLIPELCLLGRTYRASHVYNSMAYHMSMLRCVQAADFFADTEASKALSRTTAARLFNTDPEDRRPEIVGETMVEVSCHYACVRTLS